MFGNGSRAGRHLLVPATLLLALSTGACGGDRLLPVTGRVLINGKPLEGKEGTVVLKPDASKGNKSRVAPFGSLKLDGTFSVLTDGRPGAPAGWYKVVVTAFLPGANPNEESRPMVNARYMTAAATPLAFEVAGNPSPESYDLKLTP